MLEELAKGWALLHAAGEGEFGPDFRCQFQEPVATSLMELCRARVCSFSQIFNSNHFIIIIMFLEASVIMFTGRCPFLSGTMFLPGGLLSGPMFLPGVGSVS